MKNHFITYCLIFVLTAFFSTPFIAQNKKQLYIKGNESIEQKDYFAAAQYFNQLILLDSSQAIYQYKYAEASRLNYDYDIAFHWYDKVMKEDNGKMFPETPLWMGILLKNQSKYKDAKKYFEKYAKKYKNSKDPLKKQYAAKAQQETEACDEALVIRANPLDVVINHLDSNINSRVSEYGAFEIDSVLYFSSLRYTSTSRRDKNNIAYNKLYAARKNNENWQKAQALDSMINSSNIHNANTSFNDDLTKIFVSRCEAVNNVEYNCQIYFSQYIDGKWTKLVALPPPINIFQSNNTQPHYAKFNGKNTLFFSSKRAGGEGGFDIWYSYFDKNMEFSTPVNLGKKINSAEDEITPWYVPEINTLYFSSTWHKGLGGFDIFMSEYKDKEFLAPRNAGYPINSSFNDIYYSINYKKNKAYISSNRLGSYFEEKQSCCNDIYSFAIKPLTEPPPPIDTTKYIMDQLKVLCPLTLYFHNDEPDPKTKTITTKKSYKKTYEDYIALKPKYYQEYPAGLKDNDKVQAEDRLTNFFEDSVDAGMKDLEKFAKLMEEVLARGEKVKITMKGYCSPLASTDYNVNLAKRRISSLRNYFSEYKDGVFNKYINLEDSTKNRLLLTDVEIGELPKSNVSDDVKDVKNSVYSPYAARERKIQIIAVSSFADIK